FRNWGDGKRGDAPADGAKGKTDRHAGHHIGGVMNLYVHPATRHDRGQYEVERAQRIILREEHGGSKRGGGVTARKAAGERAAKGVWSVLVPIWPRPFEQALDTHVDEKR